MWTKWWMSNMQKQVQEIRKQYNNNLCAFKHWMFLCLSFVFLAGEASLNSIMENPSPSQPLQMLHLVPQRTSLNQRMPTRASARISLLTISPGTHLIPHQKDQPLQHPWTRSTTPQVIAMVNKHHSNQLILLQWLVLLDWRNVVFQWDHTPWWIFKSLQIPGLQLGLITMKKCKLTHRHILFLYYYSFLSSNYQS